MLVGLHHDTALLPVIPLAALTAGLAVVFLARAYLTVAEVETSLDVSKMIRAHIALHFVPFAYLTAVQLTVPSLIVNMFWLAPLGGFFYTGRHTWKNLNKLHPSKLYYIFYRGNTGMLMIMPVLVIIGALFHNAEWFNNALSVYFTIHFLLIGVTVLKIEYDIFAVRSSLPPVDNEK